MTLEVAAAAAPTAMRTPGAEGPALIDLFEAYTGAPGSIGDHLGQAAARRTAGDPLVVATGADVAVFPGGGAPPSVEPFRLSTRGFKELAGVSHLAPALVTLARMKASEPDGAWREDAQRLLQACRAARAENCVALWREQIAVAAYRGREDAIAAMVDYSCARTEAILERALAEDGYLTAAMLRRECIEGPSPDLPVPFSRVMVATFFLAGMDIAHRIIAFLDGFELAWERTMVVVAGRAGRPTAGVTRDTNSVAGVIATATRGRLPQEHLLIAPHAPVFPAFDGSDLEPAAALEQDYRRLWAGVMATSELGADMFESYPRFDPAAAPSQLERGAARVSAMPAIEEPDDWFALTTRLRVVLEDPRQLLSGAVTDYASRQLVANDNTPSAVTVPGLDGEPYPIPAEGAPQ